MEQTEKYLKGKDKKKTIEKRLLVNQYWKKRKSGGPIIISLSV